MKPNHLVDWEHAKESREGRDLIFKDGWPKKRQFGLFLNEIYIQVTRDEITKEITKGWDNYVLIYDDTIPKDFINSLEQENSNKSMPMSTLKLPEMSISDKVIKEQIEGYHHQKKFLVITSRNKVQEIAKSVSV